VSTFARTIAQASTRHLREGMAKSLAEYSIRDRADWLEADRR
jgi:hypothetical protein